MGWNQTFQHRQQPPACVTTFLTGGAILVGLVMIIIKPLVGVPAVLFGVGMSAILRYFGTNLTIECSPTGFTVTRESRRGGVTSSEHRWEDVTSTRYRESSYRSNSRRQRIGYFSAQTSAGPAFEVDEQMIGFKRLIELFNTMTPHLPHIWQESADLPFTAGAVLASRDRYQRVLRSAAETT